MPFFVSLYGTLMEIVSYAAPQKNAYGSIMVRLGTESLGGVAQTQQ